MSTSFDELLRIEGGRVLASLIRFTGDIGLAEDAVQDAVLVALERWPHEGMPRNPGAWLTTTSRNKALDRIRREAQRQAKERVASGPAVLGDDWTTAASTDSSVADDRLRLFFTCCHPALAPEARLALALRTIGGLRTSEIARVCLVPESTIAQRISRAKRKIARAGIPYRVPADHELPDRLPAVLAVVYAIFTTGHHAMDGALDARVDLAEEGIRLARVLKQLMPDEPECVGLLALTLATHARRRARLDGAGEAVLMADQDRLLWDHSSIAESAALVDAVLRRRRIGPFQIQAAISCLHGLAPTFDATDWPQIAELYRMLEGIQPTPVVRVNRAVAEAELHGPDTGLALLDSVPADDVAGWHLYWSTRSELLRRGGRLHDAIGALWTALDCPMNDSDRRLLQHRLSALRQQIKCPE